LHYDRLYAQKGKNMRRTIYNPQKGRLETIDITCTDENTTWFDDIAEHGGVSQITDCEGGLVIAGSDYSYPVLIYDTTRSEINHDRLKAQELKRMHTY
jgi:prophage tail gpP-like protein